MYAVMKRSSLLEHEKISELMCSCILSVSELSTPEMFVPRISVHPERGTNAVPVPQLLKYSGVMRFIVFTLTQA